jgi:hypothetical protein
MYKHKHTHTHTHTQTVDPDGHGKYAPSAHVDHVAQVGLFCKQTSLSTPLSTHAAGQAAHRHTEALATPS